MMSHPRIDFSESSHIAYDLVKVMIGAAFPYLDYTPPDPTDEEYDKMFEELRERRRKREEAKKKEEAEKMHSEDSSSDSGDDCSSE